MEGESKQENFHMQIRSCPRSYNERTAVNDTLLFTNLKLSYARPSYAILGFLVKKKLRSFTRLCQPHREHNLIGRRLRALYIPLRHLGQQQQQQLYQPRIRSPQRLCVIISGAICAEMRILSPKAQIGLLPLVLAR